MSFLRRLFKRDSSEPKAQVTKSDHVTSSTVTCPYCDKVLDPPPKRTRKCPFCSERIVRRNDWDGKKSHISYLTEEQAQREDEKEVEQRLSSARSEAQKATVRAKKSGDSTDWVDACVAYTSFAAELAHEGRPYWEEKTLSNQADAMRYHIELPNMNTLQISASDCCDACKNFHSKKIPMSEALKGVIIPEGICTALFCNCMLLTSR